MAMKEWSADDLEGVAEDLNFVSAKLQHIATEMRSKKFEALTLQADAAFGVYRATLVKLAGDVDTEFRDQYRCSLTGEVPRWKRNQKAIQARREAKAQRISEGIEPPTSPKSSGKRRPKPG